jgi:hypothetical protein
MHTIYQYCSLSSRLPLLILGNLSVREVVARMSKTFEVVAADLSIELPIGIFTRHRALFMLPSSHLRDDFFLNLNLHLYVGVARRDRYAASVLSDGKAKPTNSLVTPDVSESTTRKRDREESYPFYDAECDYLPPAQRSSSSTCSSYADVDTSSEYNAPSIMKQCLKCDELNTVRAIFCCSCRNEF